MNKTETPAGDQSDTRFFRLFSWVILGFVIIAFGGKAVLNSKILPPITMMPHFHAVTMLSWFGLLAVQSSLIDMGRNSLHRWLGRLSPIVVISFIIFSAVISKANWDRVGDPLLMTANIVNISLFSGFYVSGVLLRAHTDTHRRLMIFATLALMGPAAARIPEIFDANVFLSLPILLAFMFTPLLHDRFVRRNIPRVTLVGTPLLFLAIPVNVSLSGLPAWVSLLESVLGAGGSGG